MGWDGGVREREGSRVTSRFIDREIEGWLCHLHHQMRTLVGGDEADFLCTGGQERRLMRVLKITFAVSKQI